MNRSISDFLYSFYPKSSYLNFQEGNLNLLITSPHGGGIRPYSIPVRKYGSRLKDTLSLELTEKIISMYWHDKPYYVTNELHRNRLDLNRNIQEAAQGNYKAESIWYEWNNIINDYKKKILTKNKYGLYIDIHSKGEDDYFELGYDLSAIDYARTYYGYRTRSKSTLDSLSKKHSLWNMLFGTWSIKNSLEEQGYKVLFPSRNEFYFNGGRNVEEFSGSGLGGIQIEVPVKVLKKDLNRVAYSLYFAIEDFRRTFC